MHSTKRIKHITIKVLKKHSKSIIRKDRAFRGIKTHTYKVGESIYFTAKPKQKGSKAYTVKYALWLIDYYHGVVVVYAESHKVKNGEYT